ncbi:MAG: PEP-CTERM sorting domain-containing protein [Nitrospirae bacterium]|nr:PEP-CTERM sorting domain-containing protein [Nitrospirota bacterium]
MKKGKVILLAILMLSMILGSYSISEAISLTYNTTFYDTDFTSAGVGGMRDGTGSSSISLTGVTGTVTSAVLYWHGPGNSSDEMANANVTFGGTDITGNSLGLSSDNCWGYANSKAYWADVTSLVSGDGSYSLDNFVKTGENINGVSLLVAFDDGNSANNRDVVFFHGNDSNISNSYDADNWNISLPGINYSSGSAYLELHVGDGQDWLDDAILINSTQLVAAGTIFQGDSTLPSPKDVTHAGNLWDIQRFDVTSFLTPGPNTLSMYTGVYSDCLSCVVAIVDLPAGAAPPPGVPEPSTLILMGSGLTGVTALRKWLKK